jgi:hypothetical protein
MQKLHQEDPLVQNLFLHIYWVKSPAFDCKAVLLKIFAVAFCLFHPWGCLLSKILSF